MASCPGLHFNYSRLSEVKNNLFGETGLKLPSASILIILMALVTRVTAPSVVTLALFLLTILLVGFRLVSLLTNDTLFQFGLSPIVGFSVVTLALLIPFGLVPRLPTDVRTYVAVVLVMTTLLIDILNNFRGELRKNKIGYVVNRGTELLRDRGQKAVFLTFLLALAIRLVIQLQNVSSILPDASLYYASARSLTESHNFSANLINDTPIVSPYQYSHGLIPRTGTWLLLSIFLSFGGISFETNKLMLVIFGSLLVFPICALVRLWFGGRLWIAGLLVAIHPTLLFFSITPFGPELLSTVFALTGIAILEYSSQSRNMNALSILLTGFLLSSSLIAWEPNFILIYLVAYVLSRATSLEANKLTVIASLLSIIGLGFTFVFSVTWSFYPLYFLVPVILISVLFRRRNKQLSGFLGLVAIIVSAFGLWLNRWYMYPQLVIYPSLNSLVRTLPLHYFTQNVFAGKIFDSVDLYFSLFRQASLLSVILLGFLSLSILPWKNIIKASFSYLYILTHAVVLIFFFKGEMGFFRDYGATRLFIGNVAIMIALASTVIGMLLEGSWQRIQRIVEKPVQGIVSRFCSASIQTRKILRVSKHKLNLMLLLGILCITFLPVGIDFYSNGYKTSMDYLQKVNYPTFMGILDSADWLRNNTSPGDIFLVAAGGTTRVWAMEIGERTFASLNIVRNGTVMSREEIGMFDVLMTAKQLNASYIILDPMVRAFRFVKLVEFYDQVDKTDIGKALPVIAEESTLGGLSGSEKVSTLEVAFVSDDPTTKVVIFSMGEMSLNPIWQEDFLSSRGWNVFLNGTMSFVNGKMILTTPLFCDYKVYAEYIFKQQPTITKDTYLILKTEQTENSLSGFYLLFTDGKSTIKTFDIPGLHVTSLSLFAGKNVRIMLVYNLLIPEVRSTNLTYPVSYDFFLLASLKGL